MILSFYALNHEKSCQSVLKEQIYYKCKQIITVT